MTNLENVTNNTLNELFLLSPSVRAHNSSTMVDLGATQNFISSNMLDIIESALHNHVKLWHASEPWHVSLANHAVVLLTKKLVLLV